MGCVSSKQDCVSIQSCIECNQDLESEDLEVLKSHTRYDDDTIKEMYQRFTEDCPNGRLTHEKFIDLCKTFFCMGYAEQYCNHVFRIFDTDKNGFIDFKEFLLAVYVTSDGTAKEKLESAFRMYDVDGNGVIDLDEMTKVVQAIYGMMGEGSADPAYWAQVRTGSIFSRMDENGDGYLTEEEFIQGCLQDDDLSIMLVPNLVQ